MSAWNKKASASEVVWSVLFFLAAIALLMLEVSR